MALNVGLMRNGSQPGAYDRNMTNLSILVYTSSFLVDSELNNFNVRILPVFFSPFSFSFLFLLRQGLSLCHWSCRQVWPLPRRPHAFVLSTGIKDILHYALLILAFLMEIDLFLFLLCHINMSSEMHSLLPKTCSFSEKDDINRIYKVVSTQIPVSIGDYFLDVIFI